ncbi:Lysine exporter protein (LYSE/YGGA) [Burkholderia sp. lig30]|jgi:threonine/homoserine/homoserine lactone efflux protein|uniref:LysE family translocator n=1 Tax=Burkholderia sp. lig30 TaxID=1192124 RepID=UPI000460BFDB|nr:LysE family translocator [Burkholderia sp. lig30]KDB06233.1 Lysine exporter protein (LYSE/YGGA) [Burkholderia sp. lig30]
MTLTYFSNFGVAFAAYLIGTAMPGPGNLSIATASLNHGRAHGLAMAAGVISGSLCWGVTAAAGMSALMLSSQPLLAWLKILGACYLMWLAVKVTRSAFSSHDPLTAGTQVRRGSLALFYLQGLGIHLTNPKAILSWLTVTTLGLSTGSPPWTGFVLVACCWVLGLGVFSAYALAFSSRSAGPFFARTRKPFGLVCGLCYCVLAAGFLHSLA